MKFNIGDLVFSKMNQKKLKIVDFEKFENLNLYYTDDNSAYPEQDLEKMVKKDNYPFYAYLMYSLQTDATTGINEGNLQLLKKKYKLS